MIYLVFVNVKVVLLRLKPTSLLMSLLCRNSSSLQLIIV